MITEQILANEFYSGPQAAKVLHVNNSRVRQLCLAGRFEGAFKFGDTWLIPRKAVDEHKRLRPRELSNAKEVKLS